MRGEYDNNLRWPFKYKVTFTLIDQLATNDDRRHIIKGVWPNVRELCSGRPKFDMNDSNGIPMFFRLDLFEKDQARYVRNDTMFIKITVDHLTERSISSSMADTGELATDKEHVVIPDDDILLMICREDEEE